MSALAGTVEAARPHVAKLATPQPSLMLGDALLKWYDIAPDDAPVPLVIRALARRCLRDGHKAGTLDIDDACLGFVILHRCENDFYFLLVSTWRNENELWETVWAKTGEDDVLFHPWPRAGMHVPTYCVWELGVVLQEREAWTRFLRSDRDSAAQKAYLADCRSVEV